MNAKIVGTAAALLLISSSATFARDDTTNATPGHQMQEKGSMKGEPGASGYSPGHQMQEHGSKGAPGASASAPGHSEALDSSQNKTSR